ncbi:MAG: hypothetical protein ACR2J3_08745 [Aridibacter sp.]
MAVAVVIAFFFFVNYLRIKKFSLIPTIVLSILLIAGSTLIQGVVVGFYTPIAGDARSGTLVPYSLDGQEYFHDALLVTDPLEFFQQYNKIQSNFHQHTKTHPPGPVLGFYFLRKLLHDPGLITLFIMILASVLTTYFFYQLMLVENSKKTAGYMTFILMLLPVVQIYYLATIDAIVTALLTGTLYLFCFGKGYKAIVGAAFMLFTSFMLTFVSLFILPVLVGFDFIKKRSLKRSIFVIGGVIIAHILIYLIFGYNAFQSFRAASFYENPQGFMLFVDPVNYLFTRIEDIAEIIFFFGPFLCILFIRGMRDTFKDFQIRSLYVLTILGCTTLLGMYLVGAWRTGETARACAFIYPYLLFPIGRYLDDLDIRANEYLKLATLVFVQSVAMQTFGFYLW